jgi:hypothetical protein
MLAHSAPEHTIERNPRNVQAEAPQGEAAIGFRGTLLVILLRVPSAAMGATLPLPLGALSQHDPGLGHVPGRR